MPSLLITGVSSYWGERVAVGLAQQVNSRAGAASPVRLLGLDRKPLRVDIPGLAFTRGNLNNPLTVDWLTAENVETVLYLGTPEDALPFFDLCMEAGVRRIVMKSATAVYGAYPFHSLYLPETHPLDSKPHPSLRPLVELEAYTNGLSAQYPDRTLTILRFAPILGPTADTPLAQFLLNDRAPTLLGFNPLFQVLHEEDAVAALVHAALNDLPGVYHIAAADTLPLNKMLALAGKLPLPMAHPLAARLPARLTPLPLEYLRYPCLASLDRMNNDFGFTPAHTAEETVTEFSTEVRRTRYMPDALEHLTHPLRDLVQRMTRTGEAQDDE